MISKILWTTMIACTVAGCAAAPQTVMIKDSDISFAEGTIISAKTGQPVTYEELLADLATIRVIYIGEMHTDPTHHQIQLQLIRNLAGTHPDMAVGMEMFDFTYQPVLDQWSAGDLEEPDFLEKVQWYANWRFPFSLYQDILTFIKDNNLRLAGLNIPSYIPSRVRVGGIDNLLESDKILLPQNIDTTNEAHRAYVEPVFKRHHFSGNTNFEYFYQAQCLWEDTMAATIARELGDGAMVVLAGNGHIIYKFGIPDRVHALNGESFRTIYLAPVGSEVELSYADYIWVTPPKEKHGM
jgi:uncharacterized iron-regulated protein